MKIAYVTSARLPTDWAHGIQIMNTCAALAKAGVAVDLYYPALPPFINESPFSYHRVPETFTLHKLFALDMGKMRFAFILQALTFALSARFALTTPTPVYCRDEIVAAALLFLGVKNLVYESHNGAWGVWGAYAARHARAVVTVSEGLKTFYIEHGISSEKIHVIRNGIELADYVQPESKEVARTRLGLPLDTSVALYVGMFDGWKGMDTLLSAATLLSDNVILAVIGGEDKEHIAEFAQQYPHVRFLGYRPARELADNLAAADVLVVPNTGKDPISVRFTSPLKLFAYMASGKPIVASDLPSIREILSEKNGFLVTPDSPTALAAGIHTALTEREEANNRAAAAKSAVTRYTWDARAAAIQNLFTR